MLIGTGRASMATSHSKLCMAGAGIPSNSQKNASSRDSEVMEIDLKARIEGDDNANDSSRPSDPQNDAFAVAATDEDTVITPSTISFEQADCSKINGNYDDSDPFIDTKHDNQECSITTASFIQKSGSQESPDTALPYNNFSLSQTNEAYDFYDQSIKASVWTVLEDAEASAITPIPDAANCIIGVENREFEEGEVIMKESDKIQMAEVKHTYKFGKMNSLDSRGFADGRGGGGECSAEHGGFKSDTSDEAEHVVEDHTADEMPLLCQPFQSLSLVTATGPLCVSQTDTTLTKSKYSLTSSFISMGDEDEETNLDAEEERQQLIEVKPLKQKERLGKEGSKELSLLLKELKERLVEIRGERKVETEADTVLEDNFWEETEEGASGDCSETGRFVLQASQPLESGLTDGFNDEHCRDITRLLRSPSIQTSPEGQLCKPQPRQQKMQQQLEIQGRRYPGACRQTGVTCRPVTVTCRVDWARRQKRRQRQRNQERQRQRSRWLQQPPQDLQLAPEEQRPWRPPTAWLQSVEREETNVVQGECCPSLKLAGTAALETKGKLNRGFSDWQSRDNSTTSTKAKDCLSETNIVQVAKADQTDGNFIRREGAKEVDVETEKNVTKDEEKLVETNIEHWPDTKSLLRRDSSLHLPDRPSPPGQSFPWPVARFFRQSPASPPSQTEASVASVFTITDQIDQCQTQSQPSQMQLAGGKTTSAWPSQEVWSPQQQLQQQQQQQQQWQKRQQQQEPSLRRSSPSPPEPDCEIASSLTSLASSTQPDSVQVVGPIEVSLALKTQVCLQTARSKRRPAVVTAVATVEVTQASELPVMIQARSSSSGSLSLKSFSHSGAGLHGLQASGPYSMCTSYSSSSSSSPFSRHALRNRSDFLEAVDEAGTAADGTARLRCHKKREALIPLSTTASAEVVAISVFSCPTSPLRLLNSRSSDAKLDPPVAGKSIDAVDNSSSPLSPTNADKSSSCCLLNHGNLGHWTASKKSLVDSLASGQSTMDLIQAPVAKTECSECRVHVFHHPNCEMSRSSQEPMPSGTMTSTANCLSPSHQPQSRLPQRMGLQHRRKMTSTTPRLLFSTPRIDIGTFSGAAPTSPSSSPLRPPAALPAGFSSGCPAADSMPCFEAASDLLFNASSSSFSASLSLERPARTRSAAPADSRPGRRRYAPMTGRQSPNHLSTKVMGRRDVMSNTDTTDSPTDSGTEPDSDEAASNTDEEDVATTKFMAGHCPDCWNALNLAAGCYVALASCHLQDQQASMDPVKRGPRRPGGHRQRPAIAVPMPVPAPKIRNSRSMARPHIPFYPPRPEELTQALTQYQQFSRQRHQKQSSKRRSQPASPHLTQHNQSFCRKNYIPDPPFPPPPPPPPIPPPASALHPP
ncbi:unnamed protein product, partial [Protopolystoma xenopodis]